MTNIEIPETLLVEQAREKFAIMMTEFKDQGESDEKIQKMITKEVKKARNGSPFAWLPLLKSLCFGSGCFRRT